MDDRYWICVWCGCLKDSHPEVCSAIDGNGHSYERSDAPNPYHSGGRFASNIKGFACFDGPLRKTGIYEKPQEAQLFCRKGWHVEAITNLDALQPREAS